MEPTASERFWSTAADGPQQTAVKQSALWQCTDPCGGILECYWHLHTPLKSQVICGVKRGFSPDTIPSRDAELACRDFYFSLTKRSCCLLLHDQMSSFLSHVSETAPQQAFFAKLSQKSVLFLLKSTISKAHQMHPQNQTGVCHCLQSCSHLAFEGSLDAAAEVLWFGERSGCP